MKTRRRFLVAFGIATLTPRGALAQAKKAPVVIGWLHLGSRETDMSQLAAFKEGLAALGYKEGQQYVIEERWAHSRIERMQVLAEELAAKKPAVIVPPFSPAARAAVKARSRVRRRLSYFRTLCLPRKRRGLPSSPGTNVGLWSARMFICNPGARS